MEESIYLTGRKSAFEENHRRLSTEGVARGEKELLRLEQNLYSRKEKNKGFFHP